MADITISSSVELDRELGDSERAVVLFTAPSWCVPCRQFHPHWKRASEAVDDINFLYVDVDDNAWAMVDYGISSVPTVKLFENGTFVRDVKAPQGALPFLRDIGE